MYSWLVTAVLVTSGMVAVLGLASSLRKAVPGPVEFGAGAGCAVVVAVQSLVAGVAMIRGSHPPEQATTIGYLIGIVLVMPLGLAWAFVERTRTSGYVLAVAAFTCAVMTARLLMLWRGASA